MIKRFKKTSRRHPSGYVLLMTLLLLVLVATAMTAACRLSLSRALAAEESERLLQVRWATLSCEQALLPNCETVLSAEEHRAHQPESSLRRSVVLCGNVITLTFCDESAKINPASLLSQVGRTDAEIQLRELLSGTGVAGKIHLRPVSLGHMSGPSDPVLQLGSYGAIFENIDPSELFGSPQERSSGPAKVLTCWGDGKVNWRRGAEKILRQRLCPPLDLAQVQRLITARSANDFSGQISLSNALDTCGLNSLQRSVATDRLSDGSTCHALWIQTPQGDQAHYCIWVNDESTHPPQVIGFEW